MGWGHMKRRSKARFTFTFAFGGNASAAVTEGPSVANTNFHQHPSMDALMCTSSSGRGVDSVADKSCTTSRNCQRTRPSFGARELGELSAEIAVLLVHGLWFCRTP